MNSGVDNWDDEDLPDAAFTENELTAGVQHVLRTGDPNATSSYHRKSSHVHESSDAVDDEFTDKPDEPTRFETFAVALDWAKANPGRSFSRVPSGRGFEPKPSRPTRRSTSEAQRVRCSEMKALAPHLHEVLTKSGSGSYGVVMRPLYRSTWSAELSRLDVAQLRRLRLLLVLDLEDNRTYLSQLYAEMRRFPSMRGGDYGQELFEKLQGVIKGAIADVEERVAR